MSDAERKPSRVSVDPPEGQAGLLDQREARG